MATDSLMSPLTQVVLEPGYIVKFEAINPTTGAAVAGVKVQNVSISGGAVALGPPTGPVGDTIGWLPGPTN